MRDGVVSEIEEIRKRLEEIVRERQHLLSEDIAGREVLIEEERRLEKRLAELEYLALGDDTGEAEATAAEQTDITQTPRLPEEEPDGDQE